MTLGELDRRSIDLGMEQIMPEKEQRTANIRFWASWADGSTISYLQTSALVPAED